MSNDTVPPERRVYAVITGGEGLGAIALGQLLASGIIPVQISEPLHHDDWFIDQASRELGPLESAMMTALARRRHDERSRWRHPIHERLFNPLAAPAHVTMTDKPLTKRQRRRLRGKSA